MYKKIKKIIPLKARIMVGPPIAFFIYLWNVYFVNKKHPVTLSTQNTLEKITKEKLSVLRFGDGEMSLIKGTGLAFQKNNYLLSNKLKEVLLSDEKKLLICIPNIFGKIGNLSKRSLLFTLHHLLNHRKDWEELTTPLRTYGDSFITRPYLIFRDKEKSKHLFSLIKSIWEAEIVTLIEGCGTRFGVGNDLLSNAKSVERILCPSEDAFAKYDLIKNESLKIPKENLILLSVGPTAKILGYELFKLGYRVIDIGHVDMEYEMFLRQKDTIQKIGYKYFNEIEERKPEECKDPKYLSQIIAKII